MKFSETMLMGLRQELQFLSKMEELLLKNKLIPLATLETIEEVNNICEILLETGLQIFELTLRSAKSYDVAKEFQRFPDITLGLGTIKSKEDIDFAITVNAKFGVSPGFSKELSNHAIKNDFLLIPGVITPSEVMNASNEGHKLLKLFPAKAFNAISLLKNYEAIFKDINFIPTGGINADNMYQFLERKNVIAVGASALFPSSLIKNKQWQEIRTNLEDFLSQ